MLVLGLVLVLVLVAVLVAAAAAIVVVVAEEQQIISYDVIDWLRRVGYDVENELQVRV